MGKKLWSSFLCWNCIWRGGGAACYQHKNLNCRYSARRKDVQILGLSEQDCTKWVKNYDLVFSLETAFRGAVHLTSPQIWIAERARRKGVQNLGLNVQNCTKWVQNYGTVFHVETTFGGDARLPPNTPNFELRLAEGGRMYKVWELVFKIVIHFFILKLHFVGLLFTSPPNLNCG